LSPPPLAWQPLQLYQPKSRLPSESAYAFSSYFASRLVSVEIAPGCTCESRTGGGVTAFVGGSK